MPSLHVLDLIPAVFASNPHIVQPKKSDYAPPSPLQARKIAPLFPSTVISRLDAVPTSGPPVKDPFSADSRSGTFSTSLKGTRALLRKGGRRAEHVVQVVEEQLREWLRGKASLNSVEERWEVIDAELVDLASASAGNEAANAALPSSPPTSRRMPEQHQIRAKLPQLPFASGSNQIPAIMELSRSPAHLTWAIPDSYDRLVTHLVARYYELVSWSDDHVTVDDQHIRLTHMIVPSLAMSKAPPSTHAPFTPETSDLSATSASETEQDTSTASERDSDAESHSDAETEMGDTHELGDVSSATIVPPPQADLVEDLGHLGLHPLQRIPSNTSSAYASSEADSEYDLVDSVTLSIPSAPGSVAGNGGWTTVAYSDAGSDFADDNVALPSRTVLPMANLVRMGAKGWEERPTFFEYLYGDQ